MLYRYARADEIGTPFAISLDFDTLEDDTVTLRERVAEHLEVVECAGCHNLVDPIGLALENYDGLGVWRELDNGAPIDANDALIDGSLPRRLAALEQAARARATKGDDGALEVEADAVVVDEGAWVVTDAPDH